jgi:hypothetical protein
MVRLKADVILVSTTPAGFAVKSPATIIAVVFPNPISPVESGLIESLAQPSRLAVLRTADVLHFVPAREPRVVKANTRSRAAKTQCLRSGVHAGPYSHKQIAGLEKR